MQSEGFRRPGRHVLTLAGVAAALAVGGAGVSQAAPTVTKATPIPAHARITLRSSEYGKVIVDARGRVLYLFAADKSPTSTCYGACAKAWPPILTRGAPTAGVGLDAKLLGTTKRKNGSRQVTYNGHPLYYFESDTGHKIMCQHANMHGGFWYVVKANGTPNLAKGKMHM